MKVINRDLREFGGHCVDGSLPQCSGERQDVGFVHEGQSTVALRRRGKSESDDALDSVRGVDRRLRRDFVGGPRANRPAVSDVRAFRAFAHDDKIHVARVH